MSIHIGNVIQKLVKERGLSVTEFAKKINYSRRNVYEIFDKKTIDTGLLIRINKILNQNLFLLFISESELIKQKNVKSTHEELSEILDNLKLEIKRLKDISKK